MPSALAVLPNGEGVRPDAVRGVWVEPAPSLAEEQGERFSVVIELEGGQRRAVATALARADATDLARRCARAINEAARP